MRVLIVDDSPVLRLLLRSVCEDAGFEVCTADSGEQALTLLESYTPDIVTMDVHMPGIDGYETTGRILERYALPVVVLTASANANDAVTAMRALAVGALAVVEKPRGLNAPDFEQRIDELLRTLRSLAQIKVVRRPRPAAQPQKTSPVPKPILQAAPRLVAIGASAGGPVALKSLLQGLQQVPPWPMVLVQHISTGFLPSFCQWLASLVSFSVQIAEDGQLLQPGVLYLAPDGKQLGVNAEPRVQLQEGTAQQQFCPSIDHLFNSVARRLGNRAIGIQLSGMGRDGAVGLAELRRQGALTLVQEPGSAVIDSMPRAAIDMQAACQILGPEQIAATLNALARQEATEQAGKGGGASCTTTLKS
ncbi:chemotaxis protein CheB [Pseudomonas sp.]|uniref:chemotaxis protein CheB n=1 Tax=Pseudomonas sp. TaxID=306 RepID=UPI002BBBD1A9|nr:chemotaxis protein CheB [Pseudomonas sp.]HUE94631.1 chemotaxis protein CheB [Pseudomonas sp.]